MGFLKRPSFSWMYWPYWLIRSSCISSKALVPSLGFGGGFWQRRILALQCFILFSGMEPFSFVDEFFEFCFFDADFFDGWLFFWGFEEAEVLVSILRLDF